MKTVKKMSIITLVDISRSTPGKVFETSMSEKQYNLLKKKGKLGPQWKPKNEIKSISVETVDNPEDAGVVIEEEAVEETVAETSEETKEEETVVAEPGSYESMDLKELRDEAKKRGLKFHHASREKKLIALLTEDDNK